LLRWVSEGLNRSNRNHTFLYYIHFFTHKYICVVLIILGKVLSPDYTSYLLVFLFNFQVCTILSQIKFRIYAQLETRIISLINEVILLVVLFFTKNIISASSESNEYEKFEDTYVFIVVFFGINIVNLVVQTGFLIHSIVVFIWSICCCCFHKKKKKNKKKQNKVRPEPVEESKENLVENTRRA
jgi:hypothetical protein